MAADDDFLISRSRQLKLFLEPVQLLLSYSVNVFSLGGPNVEIYGVQRQ